MITHVFRYIMYLRKLKLCVVSEDPTVHTGCRCRIRRTLDYSYLILTNNFLSALAQCS
jgi:hypothetical protein